MFWISIITPYPAAQKFKRKNKYTMLNELKKDWNAFSNYMYVFLINFYQKYNLLMIFARVFDDFHWNIFEQK